MIDHWRFEVWSERHTPESSFGGAFSSSWSQQAPHRRLVGGQPLDREVSGSEHRVFAVQHDEAWTREATGYHAPLLIDLGCEHPFAVHGYELGAEMGGFAATRWTAAPVRRCPRSWVA